MNDCRQEVKAGSGDSMIGADLEAQVVCLVNQQLDLLAPLQHLLDVVHHDVLHLADLRSA